MWEALTKPEHLKEWYMPGEGAAWRAPRWTCGGIFSIGNATGDGQEFPNPVCFVEPMERLWTSMLFPGFHPAAFDDIPITAIVTMEAAGTRYVVTARRSRLRGEPVVRLAAGTEVAAGQLVEHVESPRQSR